MKAKQLLSVALWRRSRLVLAQAPRRAQRPRQAAAADPPASRPAPRRSLPTGRRTSTPTRCPRAPSTTSSSGRHALGHLRALPRNPYLWPQIWDQNRYITDAHWIYPGDPSSCPRSPSSPSRRGPGAGRRARRAGAEGEGARRGSRPARRGRAAALGPVTEEATMQCAAYVVSDQRGREPATSSAPSRAPTSSPSPIGTSST